MYSNYGWCIHIYSVTTCPGCLVNKREREATRFRTQKVSILLFVFAFRSADFRLLNPLLVEWACWSDKSKPSDCRDVSQRVNLPRAPNSRSHLLLACLLTEAASEKKLSRVPYIPFILYSRKGHLSGTIYVCTSSSYEVRRYSGNQLRKVRPDFHMILSLPFPRSVSRELLASAHTANSMFMNLHVIYAQKRFLARNKASFRWQSGKASQKSHRSLFHLMSAAGTLGRVCTSNNLQVPACTALHATHTQPLPIVIVLSEGLSSASSAPVL